MSLTDAQFLILLHLVFIAEKTLSTTTLL